jgi:hypothetical protein
MFPKLLRKKIKLKAHITKLEKTVKIPRTFTVKKESSKTKPFVTLAAFFLTLIDAVLKIKFRATWNVFCA